MRKLAEQSSCYGLPAPTPGEVESLLQKGLEGFETLFFFLLRLFVRLLEGSAGLGVRA